MQNSEALEDLDSWEVIPIPYVQQRPSSSTQLEEEDKCEHEGVQVSKEEPFGASSSSSSSTCSETEDGELQKTPQPDSLLDVTVWMGKQMRLGIGNLSRRIVSAASFFWPCADCRTKTWTLNSITAFMAAVAFTLAYARIKRLHKKALEESRQRILILLRRQEQKISQLLLQIARMNEMLSARHTVPVLRTY